ncbi:MAG TPA: sulfoxide reductase heme-binding subunit YedZ, partial [bacterium]|nr:sulfoxide reductase heme-binding subunit YedZ [bacterium]
MKRLIRYGTHVGSLIPLGWLVYDFVMQNLSFNPIQDLTLRTGKPALILLVLSLAITPVKILTGQSLLLPLRKIFGMYAAFYATVHLSIFVGLDYFFDWALI